MSIALSGPKTMEVRKERKKKKMEAGNRGEMKEGGEEGRPKEKVLINMSSN